MSPLLRTVLSPIGDTTKNILGLAVAISLLAAVFYAGYRVGRGPREAVTARGQRYPITLPDRLDKYPHGAPVEVATVDLPPEEEERIETQYGLDLANRVVLAEVEFPELKYGGRGVVTVPVPDDTGEIGRVRVDAVAVPPPLFDPAWNPQVELWYGKSGFGGETFDSWSAAFAARDLLCIKGVVCANGRAGVERRFGSDGWFAEAGISIKLR